MGPKGRMSEWLSCLLVVWLLMWMGLFDLFRRVHFLKVSKEIESLIMTSLITWLPGWLVAWVDPGGGGVTFSLLIFVRYTPILIFSFFVMIS